MWQQTVPVGTSVLVPSFGSCGDTGSCLSVSYAWSVYQQSSKKFEESYLYPIHSIHPSIHPSIRKLALCAHHVNLSWTPKGECKGFVETSAAIVGAVAPPSNKPKIWKVTFPLIGILRFSQVLKLIPYFPRVNLTFITKKETTYSNFEKHIPTYWKSYPDSPTWNQIFKWITTLVTVYECIYKCVD